MPPSDYRALQNQVRELHRLLGKKTLEAEILKEALEHATQTWRSAGRDIRRSGSVGHHRSAANLKCPPLPDDAKADMIWAALQHTGISLRFASQAIPLHIWWQPAMPSSSLGSSSVAR